jgi:T5SS/PEP-CTERM-associated repeat protein
LYASTSDFFGDGTITVSNGGILDADLLFDADQGDQAITSFGSGGLLRFRAAGPVLGVGYQGNGSMTVGGGICVSSGLGILGDRLGSTGLATITGAGSQWLNSTDFSVGSNGSGKLIIDAGGKVSNTTGYIGQWSDSTSTATVTGKGSQWANGNTLNVGYSGSGTLTVADEGLVTVGGILTIDFDLDNDSFINMATGGMLALYGDANDSLRQFLDLVSGTDAIRFWDDSIQDWSPLTTATYGTDYTLRYLTEGDLAGYTLLTVGTAVPEPATWLLTLGVAMVGSLVRRR